MNVDRAKGLIEGRCEVCECVRRHIGSTHVVRLCTPRSVDVILAAVV